MTPFEKLFVHLFARGMEHYRDSNGVLRQIDEILRKDEETLYNELKEAIQQANRLNLLQQYGVPMGIGDEIAQEDLPEDLMNRLLEDVISDELLKKSIKKKVDARNK